MAILGALVALLEAFVDLAVTATGPYSQFSPHSR
jgi:hypothetical protein